MSFIFLILATSVVYAEVVTCKIDSIKKTIPEYNDPTECGGGYIDVKVSLTYDFDYWETLTCALKNLDISADFELWEKDNTILDDDYIDSSPTQVESTYDCSTKTITYTFEDVQLVGGWGVDDPGSNIELFVKGYGSSIAGGASCGGRLNEIDVEVIDGDCGSGACCNVNTCYFKPHTSQPTGYSDYNYCLGTPSPTGTDYIYNRDYGCSGVDAGEKHYDSLKGDCGVCSYCKGNYDSCSYYYQNEGCGTEDCDSLDTSCRDYHDVSKVCTGGGTCKALTACSGSYTNKPSGTSCGSGASCDGNGNCNSIPECTATDTSCGNYPNCVNCNSYDKCSGDTYYNYYCVSNSQGCNYNTDNCNDCSCSCGNYNKPEADYCFDGKDNDCNGLTDSEESECSAQIVTVCKSGHCDYTGIQAAINGATNGDTIRILDSSIYPETIEFTKEGLTLDCNGAIMDGTGLAVERKSCGSMRVSSAIFSCLNKNARVLNCEIRNYGADAAIYMSLEWQEETYIADNKIYNCQDGIMISCRYMDEDFATKGAKLDIKNNVLHDNHGWAISTDECREEITGNTLYNNGYVGNPEAIYSKHTWVSKIRDNKIYSNYKGMKFGLTKVNDISWVDVDISGNKIYSNTHGGFEFSFFKKGNVENNEFYSNEGYGLWLNDVESIEVNNNKFCPSNALDFQITKSTGYYGDNNRCDLPNGWNDAGTTGCTNSCIESVSLSFNSGWNLMSSPLDLVDDSVSGFSNTIPFTELFSYDSGWVELNNNIDERYGMWMSLNNAGTYEVSGIPFGTVTYQINDGWNLLNYPSLEEGYTETLFFDVRNDIDKIYSMDGGWKSYKYGRGVNNLIVIKPGMGIWVKANKDTSWVFDDVFSSV